MLIHGEFTKWTALFKRKLIHVRYVLPTFSTNSIINKKTNQSKSSDDVLFAIHRQASQQLPLHAALVGQLFQGCLWVLRLCPLLSAADQEFFLR